MKNLQVRVFDDLGDEADSGLDEIGMDMSTAIRVHLKKIVQSRSVPFALSASGAIDAEDVEVDTATHAKMDKVAEAWRKARG